MYWMLNKPRSSQNYICYYRLDNTSNSTWVKCGELPCPLPEGVVARDITHLIKRVHGIADIYYNKSAKQVYLKYHHDGSTGPA
jgi:hypothetical protein